MSRPDPPYAIRAGHEWVAVPDTGWRLALPEEAAERKCRRNPRHPCPGTPVAALDRPRWWRGERVTSWWFYCAEHMFGRWIEDGVIMSWRVRAKEAR